MTMLGMNKSTEVEYKNLKGIIKYIDSGCALIDFGERGVKMYQSHQLHDAYVEGEFKILQKKPMYMLESITDPIKSKRYNYIKAVVECMHESCTPTSIPIVKNSIHKAELKFGQLDGKTPSVSAAKRWFTKWKNNGYSINFVLKKSKEHRRSQFTRECESLADEVIQAQYLQFPGVSVSETYKIFLEEFNACLPKWEQKNVQDNSNTQEIVVIKPMSRSSFYAHIKKLDPYEVDKARLGLKTARKIHRCVQGSILVDYPLERVEIDAMHPNIALEVKMKNGSITYERPIVYVAIDVFTRLVVGYVIDYSEGKPGETANAVVELIKQICNPLKIGKHTGIPFPLGGKPDSIVSDSGRAFTATTIKMMLQSQGIEHHITQKASPWKKPFVERFFGTMKSQCMHKLPSYAGVRIRGKELDNTLEQMAQFNRDEFETHIEHYILTQYHNRGHQGIDGLSPIIMWEKVKDGAPPILLCDFKDISKFRGQQYERKICSPKGVLVNGVYYNCRELQELGHILARRNGNRADARKVKILCSTTDISEITVINPIDDELICVSSITSGVTEGLSLKSFKAAKKARTNQKNNNSGISYVETMRRLKDKKSPKKPGSEVTKYATDITQKLSDDANDEMFKGGISVHVESHSHKVVTQGEHPSKAVRTTAPMPQKPSKIK